MAKKPKVLPALDWLEPRVKISRLISLSSFFGLIALLSIYYLWIADLHGARPWVILLIELVPLLLFAPGIISGSPRAYSWLCFVVNLYFIKGALAAFDPNRSLFGILEMLASLAVFVSALLYIRWTFQRNRKLAGEDQV
ncbi:putative membrane protein [Pseudomonas savastanoi pv. glycinea]|nr:putative membrane protein [Pseudomonas savastanoi pv. glycinea]